MVIVLDCVALMSRGGECEFCLRIKLKRTDQKNGNSVTYFFKKIAHILIWNK